ncbi:MAG: hypothetical protein QOC81_1075 [Thermoanaerobaculia bacterium]|nr:hypothetical protein [Thermoanaerobaculia bacterium]
MRNGRQSVLLSERAGWRKAFASATLDTAGGTISLRRLPASIRLLVDPAGSFGGLTDPTGMAVDPDGRIYVLDSNTCELRRFDPCTAQFETVDCIGGEGSEPRRFQAPHGIAISPAGDLIVADTGNRRLQIFLLAGLALREIRGPLAFPTLPPPPPGRRRPSNPPGPTPPLPVSTWEPWDIAVTKDCHLYVSDRANGLVHRFDRAGRWIDAIDGFEKPTAIAIGCDGSLYVIQEGKPDVIVVASDGSRRVIARADEAASAFWPPGIGVDAGDPPAYETEGAFVSAPLDSGIYNCQWHRIVVRGAIAAGTQLRVETFTSESPKTDDEIRSLSDARWMTRQDHTRTGEGEWDCLILSPPGRYCWIRITLTGSGEAAPRIDAVRVHFPRASSLQYLPAVYSEEPVSRDFLSRFLSLFDTIRDGISDRVRDAALYFDPEATPAEPASRGATDFLTWLGTWIGLAVESNWPVAKRRRLVRDAHRLYELRGTPEGLRLHVQLYAGREPRILEHFRLRQWMFLGSGRLGDCSALFGSSIVRRLQLDRFSRIGEFQLVDFGDPLRDPFHAQAHRFSVMVPLRDGADEESERRILERVIELSKPAHTKGDLQLIRPAFRIGVQSFVGVDTVVAAYPAETVTDRGRLGRDTVLSASPDEANPPAIRAGTKSRIGVSTQLR